MRKVIENMLSGADQGVGPILAAAVTRSLKDAMAAFVAATDQNGAFAPKALGELIGREPDRLTPESLAAAIAVANATADWRAGGSASWPNGPSEIDGGEAEEVLGDCTAFVLNAVAAAGGPERQAYDTALWAAYAFGSGASRVALVVPRLPHPNDRAAPTHHDYAVVCYLVREDERDTGDAARRENWGYRMTPIEKLAA